MEFFGVLKIANLLIKVKIWVQITLESIYHWKVDYNFILTNKKWISCHFWQKKTQSMVTDGHCISKKGLTLRFFDILNFWFEVLSGFGRYYGKSDKKIVLKIKKPKFWHNTVRVSLIFNIWWTIAVLKLDNLWCTKNIVFWTNIFSRKLWKWPLIR